MSQYKSPNLITKCPDNFNAYIDSQHDKIMASAERGTLGYYLRDNKKYWVGRFSAEERRQMGIEEVMPTSSAKQVAQMRHANRTPEQVADIKERWNKRKNLMSLADELDISVGKPMTHEQADFGLSNPHFNGSHSSPYSFNCQSCVVAYEARRRGLDVAAMPNFSVAGTAAVRLSQNGGLAWINPLTGEHAKVIIAASPQWKGGKIVPATYTQIVKGVKEATQDEGRYFISLAWKESRGRSGHIFCVEKLKDGTYLSFDPQSGKSRVLNDYLKRASGSRAISVIRVDDKQFDVGIVGKVLTKQSTGRISGVVEARAAKGGVLGVKESSPLPPEVRQRRSEIRQEAKKLAGKPFAITVESGRKLQATISNSNIREWLNQPHKHYVEKNEALLRIKEELQDKAHYLQAIPDKHNPEVKAHIYETEIKGDASWIIVKEFPNGDVLVYDMTDNNPIEAWQNKK